MKYEMIFGDEKLFDGAPDDAVMAIKDVLSTKKVYYFSKNGWIKNNNGRRLDCDVHQIAMRRIEEAPEPKRWTVEDKKAGRLPEVGDHLLTQGNLAEFIGLSHAPNNWCFRRLDGEHGIQTANKDWFAPIETPAEKAQREENEFVVAMLDAASQEQLMSAGFKSGVIAAYRKLRGGE